MSETGVKLEGVMGIMLLKVELRFLPVSYGIGWLSMLIYELPLLIRYLKEDKL